jgi:predicted transcriptional regulator
MVAMPLEQWHNSGMETKRHETKLTIRLPTEIAELMRRLAARHDRSLNGEIVWALREYIAQRQEQQGKQE